MTRRNVTLQKSYKKGEEWVNKNISLQQADLAKALLVLGKANDHVLSQGGNDGGSE